MRTKKLGTAKTKTRTALKAVEKDIAQTQAISQFHESMLDALFENGAFTKDPRIEILSDVAIFMVYILVFINPKTGKRVKYRHAKSYTGITVELLRRFDDHAACNGRGSKLTQAVTENGLQVKIAMVALVDTTDAEWAAKDFHGGDIAMSASRERWIAGIKRNVARKDKVTVQKRASRKERIRKWIMKKRQKDPNFMLDWEA